MEGPHSPSKNRVKNCQPLVARQLCSPIGLKQGAGQLLQALPEATDDTPLASSWEQRKAAQRAALEAKARHKEELFRAAMERKRAAEAAEREAEFQQLYSEVLGGLAPGHDGVLTEVQEVLAYADSAQRTRKEALCKQWHKQVFEPIQERLHAAMSKSFIEDLECSLQAASDAYVQSSNTKRLFLDVILPDYNALALGGSRILQVPTADLNDPLLHDLVKAHAEKTLLSTSSSTVDSGSSRNGSSSRGSSRGSRQPGQLVATASGANVGSSSSSGSRFGLAKATARPMLETQRWAAGQIHATPYGHCIDDKTANYVVRPAAPQSLAQKRSQVFFDDFTPT